MVKIDKEFLDKVGLSGMPERQKDDFLLYVQDQLEVRIGEKIGESLSDAQLDEFERIIDNDEETLRKILTSLGDYEEDELYKKLHNDAEPDSSESKILSDYITIKWLNKNCPHYQDIISQEAARLKEEIEQNKDAILASS